MLVRRLACLGIWLLFAGLVTACTPLRRETKGYWLPGAAPMPRASLILLPIADGSERADGPAAGSGAAVTAALRDALLLRGFRVETAENPSLREQLEYAARTGFVVYVLKGTITEWEDNATEWSSKPDSAALSLELHEVRRGLVATATHRIQASTLAALPRGPDRFVSELVDHALAKMFGGPARVFTER